MFCKCFTLVTCKIKHLQNIFANVLQMFYFTCNHGLTRDRFIIYWGGYTVLYTVAQKWDL